MRMWMIGVTVGMALVLGLAGTAAAGLVTNVTDGTTLLDDDFEGVAAISQGFADDPATTDYDPVAITGTWTINEETLRMIQVSDFVGTSGSSTYPAAFGGDNYLRISRTGTSNVAIGDFTAQTDIGDLIHVEWQTYVARHAHEADIGIMTFFEGAGGTGDRPVRMNLEPDGDVTYFVGGTGGGPGTETDSGLNWTLGVWQTYEVDYVIGSNTFDLTIDGATVTGLGSEHSGTTALRSIRFGSREATVYLVDSISDEGVPVPEPGFAGLVLLGCGALLRRRRMG